MAEEKYFIKQYNRRWINLLLFMMYAMTNSIHCNQLSVINHSISAYYEVPHSYVEWTSGLFSLSYVLFFVPGIYIMEKITLKQTMILASSLSAIGAWIKALSVAPDRYAITFLGQWVLSSSFTFTFGGSARLIATWFGVHESSRASALSLFGDQIGCAAGYIVPVMKVQKVSDMTNWENNLRKMHIINASMSTLCLILITFVFKDKPENPPSIGQALKGKIKAETFTEALQKMIKNRSFLMLLIWYSICGALLRIMGSVLGELILTNFKDSDKDAGRIGSITDITSMISAPIFGYLMDKKLKFKQVGIAISTGSFISFLIFTIVLKLNKILYIYLIAVFLGMFVTSSFISGLQIGIEILYPVSEVKCTAIMAFVMQLAATIALAMYGAILRQYDDTTANLVFCFLTLVGAVICFFTPVKLNRQAVEQGATTKELKEFLPPNNQQIINRF